MAGTSSRPPDARLIGDFARWLADRQDRAAVRVEDEVSVMRAVMSMGPVIHADLANPHDVGAFVEAVKAVNRKGDPGTLADYLSVLSIIDEFVVFQRHGNPNEAAWAEADTLLQDVLVKTGAGVYGGFEFGLDIVHVEELLRALACARKVDEKTRREALAVTGISSAVGPFLAWLGSGRAITQTGLLRLADIGPVAAMLGIRAEGIRRRPDDAVQPALVDGPPEDPTYRLDQQVQQEESQTVRVRSMNEVPVLRAWWPSLQWAGLLEVTRARATPGPNADTWLTGNLPPLEPADALNGMCGVRILAQELEDKNLFSAETSAVMHASQLLFDAASGGRVDPTHDGDGDVLSELAARRARKKLDRLASVGLLDRGVEGGFTAPEALRATLVPAVAASIAAVGGTEDWEQVLRRL